MKTGLFRCCLVGLISQIFVITPPAAAAFVANAEIDSSGLVSNGTDLSDLFIGVSVRDFSHLVSWF
jgi:hypothetical protein